MASALNSLAGTMYEDFIRPCMKYNVTEKCASYILRLVVIVIGTICVLMVFVVEKLGGILQVTTVVLNFLRAGALPVFASRCNYWKPHPLFTACIHHRRSNIRGISGTVLLRNIRP
jgi:Na+/proline symporter